jgi:hypothetical protein
VLEKIGFVYQREEQLAEGIDYWYVARPHKPEQA